MRMGEACPVRRRAAQPAVSEAQQEWFHKIEDGLESVRQATAALGAALSENVKNIDGPDTGDARGRDRDRSARH